MTMRKSKRSSVILIMWVLLLIFNFLGGMANAREIVDMAGGKVVIPDCIKKLYVPSPYGSYLMYSLDPTMLINFKIRNNEDKQYLHKAVHNLPEVKKLQSLEQLSNLQNVFKVKPDLVLMWSANKSVAMQPGKMADTLNQLNLPVVYAVAESFNDYPEIYLFLGKLLGKEKRAKKLSDYFRKTLKEVEKIIAEIPREKRPTVYYAEGEDGLRTECSDSIHVELLQLAGDTDVHRCHTSNHKGMEPVSLEQVKFYNPDVIIAQQKDFYDKVVKDKDSEWQNIKAVKEGKVFLIPRTPFNWFDRPPSFMRIIGLKWLMNHLYPNEYKIDIIKEAREFYRLFLSVEVSDEQMRWIIHG